MKFRGRSRKNSDWYYGDLVKTNMPIIDKDPPYIVNEEGVWPVEENSIGVKTYYKDLSNKSIYAGFDMPSFNTMGGDMISRLDIQNITTLSSNGYAKYWMTQVCTPFINVKLSKEGFNISGGRFRNLEIARRELLYKMNIDANEKKKIRKRIVKPANRETDMEFQDLDDVVKAWNHFWIERKRINTTIIL